jgi:hypothetical protein
MSQLGFESIISLLGRAKIFHKLDRAATLIDPYFTYLNIVTCWVCNARQVTSRLI